MAQVGHLSGSTDGDPIPITATSTPGTTVHTATAETDEIDMVHLYAVNNHSANLEIEVEWGGTTATNNIVVTVPADSGLFRITPEGGLPAQNSAVIACFAGSGTKIAIYGKVVRLSSEEAFN